MAQYNHIITWSEKGDSFIILDQLGLMEILPEFFSTNKVSSFIRQLNLYGFKKKHNSKKFDEFWHTNFKRDNLEEALNIGLSHKKQVKIPATLEQMKIETDNLKKSFSNLNKSINLISSHNQCLANYNKRLFLKLNQERVEYKDGLMNLIMLFFNNMKDKNDNIIALTRKLLFNTKVLSTEEKTLLEKSHSFSDLIPLISNKIIEDRNTKNNFFHKFINLFEFEDEEDKQLKRDMIDKYLGDLVKNEKNKKRLKKLIHFHSCELIR